MDVKLMMMMMMISTIINLIVKNRSIIDVFLNNIC